MKVHLAYSHTVDPRAWAQRHARHEVPDRLPYGADHLAGFGIQLSCRQPLRGGAARAAARAAHAAGGGLDWVESLADRAGPQRSGADVVVCWDERPGVPTSLLRPRTGGPALVTGVVWLSEPDHAGARVGPAARAALRRAQALWCHSRAQVPQLRDAFGVPERRLHWLPLGIDAAFFAPREPAPAAGGMGGAGGVVSAGGMRGAGGMVSAGGVVSVGDDRHRDHELLLRAMSLVVRHHPAARLTLATRLPVEVPAHLGTLRRAHLGPAVRDLYAGASLVAVATRHNLHGSGLGVALEAMASQRPVVMTANPGVADYVAHEETGLLVPPGDPDALAGAICRLLSDPELAEGMGRAGRRRVLGRFTSVEQARRLARLLQDLG